jgi:hypothetical protein
MIITQESAQRVEAGSWTIIQARNPKYVIGMTPLWRNLIFEEMRDTLVPWFWVVIF